MSDQSDFPTADYDSGALGPGAQVGQFRIEKEIGRGAMGIVYLAQDTKLNRPVAIKSLPDEVVADPKARSRFSREARMLATLSHPNIATIYDEFQEAAGKGYLILEYVPGQTLAEHVGQGGLKLQDVLSIALQIAEAMSAAHDHNVIHRDLKPSNIKISSDGKVKVLDFGLAKAVGSETVDQQSTITEPGKAMGTPAYMSPEQARGQSTDKRSDIWAFGCILYEMLTATIPFRGETLSDTMANILNTEPDWNKLPESTPVNLKVLLRRCLVKDSHMRLRDIGDAGIEIGETLRSPETVSQVTPAAAKAAQPIGLNWLIVFTLLCLLLGTIIVSVITLRSRPARPKPLAHFPVSLPPNQTLRPQIAVSPDGKRLVFAGRVNGVDYLYLRELGQLMARKLSGTKDACSPFFSPDGKSIGFKAGGKLMKLSLDGGRPIELCNATSSLGGCWSPEGVIYFVPSPISGIWKVSADGGAPEKLTTPNNEEGEFSHWWPEILPGSNAMLFTMWRSDLDNFSIAVLSLSTGQWKTLLIGASNARYAPTGHLLYAQDGALWAAPFDLERLDLGKPRRPVIEHINQMLGLGWAS